MATHGDRAEDGSFDISDKAPKFYKIIFENTIPEGKFRIPMKFVRKYGDLLSSPLTLKVPNGETWQVELLKVGNEIWVQKGFQEFAVSCSLEHGHLLLFIYEGGSNFSVRIFDMSSMEIKYPNVGIPSMDPDQDFEAGQEREDQEDDIDCREMDDLTINNGEEDSLNIAEQSEGDFTEEEGTAKPFSSSPEAANNRTSSDHPSIEIVYKGKTVQAIPFAFVQMYMKGRSTTVMLQVEGKSWPVGLNVYLGNRTAIFSRGWPAFARENSFKIGDVYKFDVINKDILIVSKSEM